MSPASNTSPSPVKERKPKSGRLRRLRRAALFYFGSLALLACLTVLVRAGFIVLAELELAKVTAELDRTDPGWRWEQILAARRPVPDGENSAPWVLNAARDIPAFWPERSATKTGPETDEERLRRWQKLDRSLPRRLESWNPEFPLDEATSAEIEVELKALGPVVGECLKLSEAPPRGRHELAWTRDIVSTQFKPVVQIEQVAAVLELAGTRAGEQNDDQTVFKSVQGMIKAGRSLGDEPTYLTLFTRLRCLLAATRVVESALARGSLKQEQILAVQRLLDEESKQCQALLPAVARGDRALWYEVCGCIITGDLSQYVVYGEVKSRDDPVDAWLFIRPKMHVCRRLHLELMDDVLQLAGLPLSEQCSGLEKLQAKLDSKRSFLLTWEHARLCAFEPFRRVLTRHLQGQTRGGAMTAALAAERFRLAKGRWPESLLELVPEFLTEIPCDPFAPGTLCLERLPDGLVIYSLGPDGEDDGGNLWRNQEIEGKVERKHGVPVGYDLGVRLWDPERRRQPAPEPKPDS